MAHRRQKIRDAVRAVLVARAGVTALVPAAKIVTNKLTAWKESQLPGIAIYTASEDTADERIRRSQPRNYDRDLRLVCEIAMADTASANVPDALDDIAEQVEAAIENAYAVETFGTVANGDMAEMSMLGTDLVLIETGLAVAALRLEYGFSYISEFPLDSDGPLDAFETANIRYDLGGDQATADETEDTIHPEQ